MGSDDTVSRELIGFIPFRSTLPRGERRDTRALRTIDKSVSIHAPAWGATRSLQAVRRSYRFRSTLPRGERRIPRTSSRVTTDVSIHAPAWGATRVLGLAIVGIERFDPRSRVGSDASIPARQNHLRSFRSTLPRGERPGVDVLAARPIGVSIHAPAWGATLKRVCESWRLRSFDPRSRVGSDGRLLRRGQCSRVSIHAPAWGATRRVADHIDVLEFRSTLPRGERRAVLLLHAAPIRVSIHAPAWGATFAGGRLEERRERFDPRSRVGSDWFYFSGNQRKTCFDPRSRVGSDDPAQGRHHHGLAFRSTLPRGERHPRATTRRTCGYSFDPRSRVGSDKRPILDRSVVQVSIHAPAWGATPPAGRDRLRRSVSIHAPAWGATPAEVAPGIDAARFDPRSRVGSDKARLRAQAEERGFDPRSRVGSDRAITNRWGRT